MCFFTAEFSHFLGTKKLFFFIFLFFYKGDKFLCSCKLQYKSCPQVSLKLWPGESPKFGHKLSSKLGTFLSNPVSGFFEASRTTAWGWRAEKCPRVSFFKTVPEGNTSVPLQKNTVGGKLVLVAYPFFFSHQIMI